MAVPYPVNPYRAAAEPDGNVEKRNLAKVAFDPDKLARFLGFPNGTVKTAYHDREGFGRIILVIEDTSLPECSIACEPECIALRGETRDVIVGWDKL